jgi:hypothetical protein
LPFLGKTADPALRLVYLAIRVLHVTFNLELENHIDLARGTPLFKRRKRITRLVQLALRDIQISLMGFFNGCLAFCLLPFRFRFAALLVLRSPH